MYFRDYSWTVYGSDNPKITGKPDSTLLNREEGYEMLYFINKMADIYNLELISDCIKIERMIREKVPAGIHSQKAIETWIVDNWDN